MPLTIKTYSSVTLIIVLCRFTRLPLQNIFLKMRNTFFLLYNIPLLYYHGRSLKGYGENLACQCQGNPLCLQIHCEVPAAEICLPANRENKIAFLLVQKHFV